MHTRQMQQIAAREILIIAILWILSVLAGFLLSVLFQQGVLAWAVYPTLALYFARWLVWALLRIDPDRVEEAVLFACCAFGILLFLSGPVWLLLGTFGVNAPGLFHSVVRGAVVCAAGFSVFWWPWRALCRRRSSGADPADAAE